MYFLFNLTIIIKNWTKNVQREIIKKKPDIIINCAASQFLNDDIKSITELFNSNLYSNIVFLEKSDAKQ